MQKVTSSNIKSSLADLDRTRKNNLHRPAENSDVANSCPPTSVTRLRFYTGKRTYIQEGGGWSRIFIETHLFVHSVQRALFLNTYSLSPRFELGPSRMIGILVNQPSDSIYIII